MQSRRVVLISLGAGLLSPSFLRASPASDVDAWRRRLVGAARAQIGVTLAYDPAYTKIAFPGGDVPRERGVCTDVVIRAYRDAFRLDLQALVNRDMRKSFSSYPKRWGLGAPDPNIDHRRVPNLQAFLARQGASLPVSAAAQDYAPGDLVTQMLPGDLPHIGVVSDAKHASGAPLVIHNIGAGAREENTLFAYRLTGHYRFAPATAAALD
jgi:uncharacterized protein YijF (DUF1287 family)